jgi:hypothetical protein
MAATVALALSLIAVLVVLIVLVVSWAVDEERQTDGIWREVAEARGLTYSTIREHPLGRACKNIYGVFRGRALEISLITQSHWAGEGTQVHPIVRLSVTVKNPYESSLLIRGKLMPLLKFPKSDVEFHRRFIVESLPAGLASRILDSSAKFRLVESQLNQLHLASNTLTLEMTGVGRNRSAIPQWIDLTCDLADRLEKT